jgi:RNA polymerase-binding transcription factor DksA
LIDAHFVSLSCAQDIDDLLKQRSHVLVTEGGAQTESWLNKRKKAGRTNKSMFTGESSKEHAEIDVNDPDFWKKVLPDLVTPDIMLERLSDDSLIDEEDESNREAVEKYMKDLAQMMEGTYAVCLRCADAVRRDAFVSVGKCVAWAVLE